MKNRAGFRVKRTKFESSVFVLLLSIICIYKIGTFTNSRFYNIGLFILGCLTIFVAVLKQSKKHDGRIKKNDLTIIGKKTCLLFFGIQVVSQIYAYLLALLGYTSFDLLSTNIYSFITPLFALGCVYLFRDKAIELFTKALIYNFVLTFVINILVFGPSVMIQVFNSIVKGEVSQGARVFEVHANSFAMGVLFLYYLFNPNENNRKKYMVFLLIGSIFGQKRIQFAAMGICIGLFYLDKLLKKGRLAKKDRFTFLQVIMVASIALCLLYVKIALDGSLSLFFAGFGVNDSYRSFFYSLMRQYANFGLGFLGIGRNAAGHLLSQYYQDHYSIVITNLHSDLLKMYVENGFWLYIVWLVIYLVYIPQKTKSISNYETALKSILFVIYMFILYLTDNVEVYSIVQSVFMLALIYTTINGMKRNDQTERYNNPRH